MAIFPLCVCPNALLVTRTPVIELRPTIKQYDLISITSAKTVSPNEVKFSFQNTMDIYGVGRERGKQPKLSRKEERRKKRRSTDQEGKRRK